MIEILKVLIKKGSGSYGTRRLKNKLAEQDMVQSQTYWSVNEPGWLVV